MLVLLEMTLLEERVNFNLRICRANYIVPIGYFLTTPCNCCTSLAGELTSCAVFTPSVRIVSWKQAEAEVTPVAPRIVRCLDHASIPCTTRRKMRNLGRGRKSGEFSV